MDKGEIVHYEQFPLFPQCFQKLVMQTCKNQGLFGKGLIFCHSITDLMILRVKAFGITVGNGENAYNQPSFPFLHCYFPAKSNFYAPTSINQRHIVFGLCHNLNIKFHNLVTAFTDNKYNGAKITISIFDRKENTVGKGENAGNQHFLLPQCFQQASFSRLLKVGTML